MIQHHPADETLMRYAAGTLEPGAALLVAAHLEHCPVCGELVLEMEGLGGQLLDQLAPAAMDADALALALARIERPAAQPAPQAAADAGASQPALGIELPRALAGHEIGRWRWAGPGMRISWITVPGAQSTTFLLKTRPSHRMLDHSHAGVERTMVLAGSFFDQDGRYGPGDLIEADDSIQHQPVVDAGQECICLVAIHGKLRLGGMLGRLIEPFMRF